MRRRSLLTSLALTFCLVSISHGQRGTTSSAPGRKVDLQVKVVLTDDHPAPFQLQVQLLTSIGNRLTEAFTNSEGEATFPGISAGAYRLRVTGIDIEETITQNSFEIYPQETTHFEMVTVARKGTPGQNVSPAQSTVSALFLQVPEKARNEFAKGGAAMDKNDLE